MMNFLTSWTSRGQRKAEFTKNLYQNGDKDFAVSLWQKWQQSPDLLKDYSVMEVLVSSNIAAGKIQAEQKNNHFQTSLVLLNKAKHPLTDDEQQWFHGCMKHILLEGNDKLHYTEPSADAHEQVRRKTQVMSACMNLALLLQSSENMLNFISHSHGLANQFLDFATLKIFALADKGALNCLLNQVEYQPFRQRCQAADYWLFYLRYPTDLRLAQVVAETRVTKEERAKSRMGAAQPDWRNVLRVAEQGYTGNAKWRQQSGLLMDSVVKALFLYPRNVSSEQLFAAHFDQGPDGQYAELAWQNYLTVTRAPKRWGHLMNESVLIHWFANTVKDSAKTQAVLLFVLQYYKPVLLESNLLNRHPGLVHVEDIIQAKCALQQCILHFQDSATWTSLLNNHSDIMGPLYQDDLPAFSAFIDHISKDRLFIFWKKCARHLPPDAILILLARLVQAGVFGSTLKKLTPEASRQREEFNSWPKVNQILMEIFESAQPNSYRTRHEYKHVAIVLANPFCFKQLAFSETNLCLIVNYIRSGEHLSFWDGLIATTPHLLIQLIKIPRFKTVLTSYFPAVEVALSIEKIKRPYADETLTIEQIDMILIRDDFRQKLDTQAKDKQQRAVLINKSLLFSVYFEPKKALHLLALEDPSRCRREFDHDDKHILKQRIMATAIEKQDVTTMLKLVSRQIKFKNFVLDVHLKVRSSRREFAALVVPALRRQPFPGLADMFQGIYALHLICVSQYQTTLLHGLSSADFCRLIAANALNNYHAKLYSPQLSNIASALLRSTDDFTAVLMKADVTNGCRQLLSDLFQCLCVEEQQQLSVKNPLWAALDRPSHTLSRSDSPPWERASPISIASSQTSLYARSESMPKHTTNPHTLSGRNTDRINSNNSAFTAIDNPHSEQPVLNLQPTIVQ